MCLMSSRKASQLFDCKDDELRFAEDYGLDVLQASTLVSLKRPVEAAQIHLNEGALLRY
jgi:hypothetical protein